MWTSKSSSETKHGSFLELEIATVPHVSVDLQSTITIHLCGGIQVWIYRVLTIHLCGGIQVSGSTEY